MLTAAAKIRNAPYLPVLGALALLASCGGGELDERSTSVSAQRHAFTRLAAPIAVEIVGKRSSYRILRTASGTTYLEHVATGDVTSIASSPAAVKFSDMTINLESGIHAHAIPSTDLVTLIELYIAFFNRVPDADGLNYWVDQFKTGMTIDQIADSFYAAAIQYSALTGYASSMTPSEFVAAIYRNVLARSGATAPPAADVDYWAQKLTNGQETKGSLVRSMLNSAHSFKGNATWGWVADLLDNRKNVGYYVAVQHGINYNSPEESIEKGSAISAAVTSVNTVQALALVEVGETTFNTGTPAAVVGTALPAKTPSDTGLPDWLITSSTSSLTGVKTTFLTASSLSGNFTIYCTSTGTRGYYVTTERVTGNGNIAYRVGTNSVVYERWSEGSGYRTLYPPTFDWTLLDELFRNWDFVLQYNAYSYGAVTLELGSAGFSSAIDKTRADCNWPLDRYPPNNGFGASLPLEAPVYAKEATYVPNSTEQFRLVTWRARNASGKTQLLARLGDPTGPCVGPFVMSDRRLYVTQDGRTVSAVSGFDFSSSCTSPVIVALGGEFDVNRPFTLTAHKFHFRTLEPGALISTVTFN